MPTPLLTLSRGDSLNAWALSAVRKSYFPGEPAPASDPQNYKYINGFVDVGDLPCRVATWRDVATRSVQLETDWPVESLYLPGKSRAVEFSQFQHRPTRLSRWCRTQVSVVEDRYCSFKLTTRGGVHIWVDGELAARFEPFTRNSNQSTVVHLPLRAGGSEIVVLTEDMAERDVVWFFELTLIDATTVDVHLPGANVGKAVQALSALAGQVRPGAEVHGGDDAVFLVFDDPSPLPVTVHARIESTSHTHAVLLDRVVELPEGAASLRLCAANELPDGFHGLWLEFSAAGSRVERHIGVPILHQAEPVGLGADLAARKRLALDHAAIHGEMRMGTAVALLETDRADDERFRPIIEDTLTAIEERRDCADFVSVPLLWGLMRHGGRFPADLRERSEQALLNFRYWVDEPGNDVMWFWSENHALCFHTSQLLAGMLWPEARFSASGRTGREQAALASERLGLWLDAVEEDGLAEWNSAAYYPVDFIGLLALVDLAPADLAARARGLCDRIFTMVSLHTLQGVPAGSMGRAYDKELRAGPLTELAPFAAVAFGRGWLNKGVASLPLFAAGSYAPPSGLETYAWPEAGQVIKARYLQGYGPAASLNLYKTHDVQLSTNSGARAGGFGHQQHVIDLRFSGHPMARSWINHPGEDDPWGQQRPSYWGGNGTLPRVGQHENIALVSYRLAPDTRLMFTHVYAARAGLIHHLSGDTLILEAGSALMAYKATGKLECIERGPAAGVEYRCHGAEQGWAAIVAEDESLSDFAARIAQCRVSVDGGGMLRLEGPGLPRLGLDWHRGLIINDTPQSPPATGVVPDITIRTL
jgi:hypothetical protein